MLQDKVEHRVFDWLWGDVNSDVDQFEDEVPGLLGEMANVEAGRVILTLLEEAGHQVDIFPLKK